MNYFTPKKDVRLAKEFQKHLSNDDHKNVVIDNGKDKKNPVKENGQTESIMFRIMLMFHTKICKFIVILTTYQYYHSVVPIQSLME